MTFPGGGVDKNEIPVVAVQRETIEETGIKFKKPPILYGTVKVIWQETWPETTKQKIRYKKFQGQEIYLFYSKMGDKYKSTSTEGDEWEEVVWYPIKYIINKIKKSNIINPGLEEYRELQVNLLTMLFKK